MQKPKATPNNIDIFGRTNFPQFAHTQRTQTLHIQINIYSCNKSDIIYRLNLLCCETLYRAANKTTCCHVVGAREGVQSVMAYSFPKRLPKKAALTRSQKAMTI